MRKLLAVMLTVVLFVPQLALCASAATDNPIVIENRISDELLGISNKENSFSKQTAEEQLAASLYSAVAGDSASLNYYVDNKKVTKKQLQMFNWSFIFSQFARPFEDSFQDIFHNKDNQFIDELLNESTIINGVSKFLVDFDIATDDGNDNLTDNKINGSNITSQAVGAFLFEDINSEEIKEYFDDIDNYRILNIYRDNDNGATLTDLLSGGLAIFQRLYIYDTVYEDSQVTEGNIYNFALDVLDAAAISDGDLTDWSMSHRDVEIPIVSKKIPIFVYDSATAFFLQLAVSLYCTSNNQTVDYLIGQYGDCPLVLDTFGNLCFYTNGQAKIVLPNFANPIFTNSIDEDPFVPSSTSNSNSNNPGGMFGNTNNTSSGSNNNDWYTQSHSDIPELYERIDMYNKWVTVAYSSTMRKTQSVFSHYTPEPLSGNRYASILPAEKNDNTNVRGNLLLVDPPTVLVSNGDKQGDVDFAGAFKREGLQNQTKNSYDYYGTICDVTEDLRDEIEESDFTNSDDLVGAIVSHSPYKYESGYGISFYPALYSYNNIKDETVESRSEYYFDANINSAFFNAHITGQTNISLMQFGFENHGSSNFTHAAIFGSTTHTTTWYITHDDGTCQEDAVMGQHAGSQYNYLAAYNESTVAIFNNNSEQILKDLRVITHKAAIADKHDVDYAEMFIPSDIIDIGQYNSAYFSDERGMFIASHKVYYSQNTNSLATYVGDVLNYFNGTNGGGTLLEALSGKTDGGAFDNIKLLDDGKFLWYATNDGFSGFPVLLGPDFSKTEEFNNSENKNRKFVEDCANQEIANIAGELESDTDKDSGEKRYVWTLPKSTLSSDITLTIKWTSNSGYKIVPTIPLVVNGTTLGADTEIFTLNDGCIELNGYDIFSLGSTSGSGGYDYGSKMRTSPEPEWILRRQVLSVLLTRYAVEKFCECFGEPSNVKFKASDEKAALQQLGTCYSDFAEALGFKETEWSVGTTFTSDNPGKCLMTPDDFLWFVFTFERNNSNGEDTIDDSNHNLYFYDEYQYYLRDMSGLTSSITDTNETDFASVLYYWERYYLPKMTFNKEIISRTGSLYRSGLTTKFYDITKDTQKIDEIAKLQLEKVATDKKYNSVPEFVFEWILHKENNEYVNLPFLGYFCNDPSEIIECITGSDNEEDAFNNLVERYNIHPVMCGANYDFTYEGMDQLIYNILPDDIVVLFPFYSNNIMSNINYLKPAEYILHLNMPTAELIVNNAADTLQYNPIQLVMGVLANTDAVHNNLVRMPPVEQTTHVSKEDLMDEAHQFFTNPVSCLEYILSGFMYKLHQSIATGDVGSVFNANWLLDSGIYKWITDRYIGFVTVIIVALLLIKLTQLAMSKTHNYMTIPKTIAGILAMVMVPVLVFNSFIWVFNATSDWALAGPANKMLLSSINKSILNSINADIGVNSELGAFKEQFSQIQGEYDGICVEEMTAYGFSNPVYKVVSIDNYSSALNPTIDTSSGNFIWYTSKGFVPVQGKNYSKSMFYYFYDYIKAEFYQYCIQQGSNIVSNASWIGRLDQAVDDLQTNSGNQRDLFNNLNGCNTSLLPFTGNFVKMLNDIEFVYGNSVTEDRYNGAYVKDLAGVYNLFDEDSSLKTTFAKASWYMAMQDADIMVAEEGTIPKRWTDQDILAEYYNTQNHDKGRVHGTTTNNNGQQVYSVFTSKLDFFVPSLNNGANQLDARVTDFALTPLEEKLCSVTEDIYSSTVKALEYHTDQIKDEAAIQLMAWIATFKVSEAFGISPAQPVQETITLDTVIRTAFIRDLDNVSGGDNALYAMVTQGDSIFRVMLVVILELAISIASILRIILILYLTVGSFVVLGLRLLHKAPATTDLVYGIVGNLLMLLFLHALTLFLVVCAVQWVSVITDTIPELLLDVIVILFIILLAVILVHLVKNLVKDAINLGGAKIKAGVKSISGAIANFFTKGAQLNALATELSSNQVTVNATNISQEIRMQQQHEEQLQDRRERAERMIDTINRVEDGHIESRPASAVSDASREHEYERAADHDLAEDTAHTRATTVNKVNNAEATLDSTDNQSKD